MSKLPEAVDGDFFVFCMLQSCAVAASNYLLDISHMPYFVLTDQKERSTLVGILSIVASPDIRGTVHKGSSFLY